MTNVKYDDDRKFLTTILDQMNANLSELETRKAILEDQISYVEHSIQALKVYEHINNPMPSTPAPVTSEEIPNA